MPIEKNLKQLPGGNGRWDPTLARRGLQDRNLLPHLWVTLQRCDEVFVHLRPQPVPGLGGTARCELATNVEHFAVAQYDLRLGKGLATSERCEAFVSEDVRLIRLRRAEAEVDTLPQQGEGQAE